MSLFTVDSDKCIGDGACVAVCPIRLLTLDGADGTPAPVDAAEAKCITCGHCTTVCPPGALELTRMPSELCRPVRRELKPSVEQVEELLQSRRSTRAYQDREVDYAVIERVINMARYAPSAHNAQTTEWLVLSKRQTVRRLSELTIDYMRSVLRGPATIEDADRATELVAAWEAGIDRVCRGAPHVVIAHGLEGSRFGVYDATIALTYFDIAAASLGLGTCWLGFVMRAEARWEPIKQLLDIPKGRVVYGVTALGYPTYDFQRIPERKEARITWR